MIKGDRLIRKFKIARVLVTPDRSRWDGRKRNKSNNETDFSCFMHFLLRFFSRFVVWIFCRQEQDESGIYRMSTCLQRRVCHNVIYLFLIYICYVWHGGRCWSSTFSPSNWQVEHFEARTHTNCKLEGKTAGDNGRLAGVMGEGGLIWGGCKKINW